MKICASISEVWTHWALGDLVDAGTRRIGAALAEARDRAVDDARVDLGHGVVVDLEAMLHVGTIVFDDDVGLGRELHEDLVAFLALEVERHRLLVAMQVLEVEAMAVAAHRIGLAVGGRLDLDDVRAPVGELAHGRRPGAMRREVENGDVGKGQGGHGRFLTIHNVRCNTAVIPSEARDLSCCLKGPSLRSG
jgi:hypothetical protein